jgi:hypothetical protein
MKTGPSKPVHAVDPTISCRSGKQIPYLGMAMAGQLSQMPFPADCAGRRERPQVNKLFFQIDFGEDRVRERK